MTVKVFVNWYDQEVLTEAEYNARAKEMAEEHRTDDYSFSEFLENRYSHRDLWDANEEERAKIMKHWESMCLDEAYDELGFEDVELEV